MPHAVLGTRATGSLALDWSDAPPSLRPSQKALSLLSDLAVCKSNCNMTTLLPSIGENYFMKGDKGTRTKGHEHYNRVHETISYFNSPLHSNVRKPDGRPLLSCKHVGLNTQPILLYVMLLDTLELTAKEQLEWQFRLSRQRLSRLDSSGM
jgi:hypothetical protein